MSKPPTKREMRIDPQACSGAELAENLGKLSLWPQRFASDAIYAGALFTSAGEPLYQDGTLIAKRVIAANLVALENGLGKVRVDANDPLAFLIDQLNDVGVYQEDSTMLVKYSGIGPNNAGWGGVAGEQGKRIQLNADWKSVHHWDDEGEWEIRATDGVVNWVTAGQVRLNDEDGSEFFADKLLQPDDYVGGSLQVKAEIAVDVESGKPRIRWFINPADVAGYMEGVDQALVVMDGVFQLVEIADCEDA